MKREIIIRISKKDDINQQQLQQDILAKLALSKESVDIIFKEYTPYEDNLANGFFERMQSLADAILFGVEANLVDEGSDKRKLTTITNQLQQILDEFKHLANNHFISPDEIYEDYLQTITKLLQDNFFTTSKIKNIAKWIDRAEQYLLLTKPRPIICTLVNNILTIDEPLHPCKENNGFREVQPHLAEYEKKLYDHAQKQVEGSEVQIDNLSLSSRLDSVKNPRNFWHETVYHYQPGELELLTQEHRLSIIASRSQETAINEEITLHNFEVAIQQSIQNLLLQHPDWDKSKAIPVLYETLITPLAVKEDAKLYALKLKAIENFRANGCTINVNNKDYAIDLIEANFSLNIGRHVLPTLEGTSNYTACVRLMLLAENYPQTEKLKNAIALLNEVVNLPYHKILLSPAYKRELYIASLMHIIANAIGVSVGGCVSAKDREAVKMLHVTAMLSYFKEHKKFPSYFDAPNSDERKDFVNRMTDLYASGHQQALSAPNAPGVTALKTPRMYLPYDVADELERQYGKGYLQREDKLASINDCHKNIAPKNKKFKTDSYIARRARSLNNNAEGNPITELSELYDLLIADVRAEKFSVGFLGGESLEGCNHKMPHQVRKTIEFLRKSIAQGHTLADCQEMLRTTIAKDFIKKSSHFSLFRPQQTQALYRNYGEMLQKYVSAPKA